MSNVIMLKLNDQMIENGQVKVSFEAIFHDQVAIPNGELQNVTFLFDFSDTPTQIENKLEDAVIEVGAQFYPSLSFPRSSMVFYDIKRGN